jgi:hypothetical protein
MGYNYREINIILLTSCKILSRALHLGGGGGGEVGGAAACHKSSGQGGKKKQSPEEQPIEWQKTVSRACSTGPSSLQKMAACVKLLCDEVQVVLASVECVGMTIKPATPLQVKDNITEIH